jgi:glycosyltransferase involved in cell wall biosynthesis
LTNAGRPRSLALLHYTAPPVPGGVESVLGTHAQLLREAGHDVRVIAGRGDAEIVPEVDSRHPEIEHLAACLAAGDPATKAFDGLRARLAERLRPLLADRDLVIVHNVLTMPFNLPLAAALADQAKPLVAWTHDLAWVNPRYRAYQRPGWPWSILSQARSGVRYVAVSRVRQSEIVRVLGLPPDDVPVVPNGVSPTAFWGLSAQTLELARRSGLDGADPLILVPVRITRRKRLELAIDAIWLLRADHPQLKMVVSGPLGPHSGDNLAYAAELREQRSRLGLNDVVIFLSDLAGQDQRHPVDDQAVAELYRMADLVVLPSESEGFGLPVLEAALSRAPLVCADIPVLREITRGHAWSFAAGGDAGAVADAARRALGSRVARLRRRALQGYGWPAVMAQVQQVIEATSG